MDTEKVKSLFLKTLIGCLIAAASLAVVTVLAGAFNDIAAKALFTILVIALHALVSFAFINNNEKQETFESLSIFTNVTFGLIVFSFFTAVFGIWGIFGGELVAKLYALYFVLLFATLHGEVLAKTLGMQSSIDNVVYANFMFMLVVVLMLLPVIFFTGDGTSLGPVYYRVLAAFGIIDATLTLIAVILHKLYIQKNPTVNDNVFNFPMMPGQPAGQNAQMPAEQPKKRGMNIFVTILILYIVLQFVGGIAIAIIGSIGGN